VLDAAMDAAMHTRALDDIFVRVFGEPGPAAMAPSAREAA
jgi:hypothetical protein